MPSKPQNKRDTDIEKCYFSRTCAFLFVASFSHLAARRKSNTGAVSLLVRLQVASCATEKHGTRTSTLVPAVPDSRLLEYRPLDGIDMDALD